jgi:hypothetical protein
MIGMRYVQGLLLNRGPGTFTRSFQLNLELTNTICQLTLADLGDYTRRRVASPSWDSISGAGSSWPSTYQGARGARSRHADRFQDRPTVCPPTLVPQA